MPRRHVIFHTLLLFARIMSDTERKAKQLRANHTPTRTQRTSTSVYYACVRWSCTYSYTDDNSGNANQNVFRHCVVDNDFALFAIEHKSFCILFAASPVFLHATLLGIKIARPFRRRVRVTTAKAFKCRKWFLWVWRNRDIENVTAPYLPWFVEFGMTFFFNLVDDPTKVTQQ